MAKIIIGLVGMLGSGKGTATKLLEERYGAQSYRFSTVLRDVLDRLSLDKTRENLVNLSEVLRQGFGEDVLAHALEQDAVNAEADLVVIDGVRRIDDLAALEPLPNFRLIAIDAPEKIRYERIRGRGENVGEKQVTWEEFQAQGQLPTEVTIPSVMARAWKTLDNSGSLDDLVATLDRTLAELGLVPETK